MRILFFFNKLLIEFSCVFRFMHNFEPTYNNKPFNISSPESTLRLPPTQIPSPWPVTPPECDLALGHGPTRHNLAVRRGSLPLPPSTKSFMSPSIYSQYIFPSRWYICSIKAHKTCDPLRNRTEQQLLTSRIRHLWTIQKSCYSFPIHHINGQTKKINTYAITQMRCTKRNVNSLRMSDV